jgi:hypothetical protein
VTEAVGERTAEHRRQGKQHDEADPQRRGAASENRTAEGGPQARPRRSGYSCIG